MAEAGDTDPASLTRRLNLTMPPDRVLDDWRREAISAIREMGHARTLSDQLLPGDPVAVTLPEPRPALRLASETNNDRQIKFELIHPVVVITGRSTPRSGPGRGNGSA